jgi:hypothetical protein
MNNTSGFYKNDFGDLLYGPNYVLSGSYNLYKEQKESYEYPVHGWYWFESEDEARQFFNLPPKPIIKNPFDLTNNIGN